MTRSMTALPSQHSRGRRKTDLMPVIPWNRSSGASPSPRPSAAASSGTGVAQRAVSMSRLDLLAQPRRRLLPPSASTSATPPSMAKSMLNLSGGSPPSRRVAGAVDPMSQSMVLPGRGAGVPGASAGGSAGRLRSARSMSQLAVAPRPTRASQLRATQRMMGTGGAGRWATARRGLAGASAAGVSDCFGNRGASAPGLGVLPQISPSLSPVLGLCGRAH